RCWATCASVCRPIMQSARRHLWSSSTRWNSSWRYARGCSSSRKDGSSPRERRAISRATRPSLKPISDTDVTMDPLLTLDRVVAGYGKMTILNGTSALIQRSAITTVIGPNGAGKSTMFKTIFGLLPVRSGTIKFDGRDTTNFTPRQLLDAGVVYIPQGRNIFPELSVRHNLELGGVTLSDQSGLPQRLDRIMQRFPMLQEKADRQASTLSGGQQKMLEVARGLLLDPKLILIDEPSIGLSPLMVQEVFTILKSLRDGGVTILLIEQNAKQALQMADFGLVLEQGQTRIEDTAATILADPRIAQLFLGGGLAQPERVS